MKILVTGGTSMVAKHIKDIYPKAIYSSSGSYNLTSFNHANALINQFHPDIVIHTAAKVGSMIDNMNHKYDYMVENMMINMNIIKACQREGIKKLIAISSTCSYPDVLPDDKYPMVEKDIHLGPPTETSIGYAYSKRMMQLAIDLCNEQYGTEYNYLTPCNIYSEYDKHENDRMHFLTRLLDRLSKAEGKNVVMDGSGDTSRQYIYGGDLARIIQNHIQNNVNESYNIGSENLKLSEWSDKTIRALGLDNKVIFANSIPAGQFRKDVSSEKLHNIYPDFKFSDFNSTINKVYKAKCQSI